MVKRIGLQDGAGQSGHAGVVAADQVAYGEEAGQEKNATTEFWIANAASADRGFRGLRLRFEQLLFGVGHPYVRFPAVVRFSSAALASVSCGRFETAGTGQRARTLDPPFTWSPRATRIWASRGTHRSTREPNRTKPIRSPRCTMSPAFFQQTTRRAMRPAICLKTISPDAVEREITFCSFSAEARARSEEHTSELQSLRHLVCRLLL